VLHYYNNLSIVFSVYISSELPVRKKQGCPGFRSTDENRALRSKSLPHGNFGPGERLLTRFSSVMAARRA